MEMALMRFHLVSRQRSTYRRIRAGRSDVVQMAIQD